MNGISLTQPLRRNAGLFADRIATVMGDRRTTWRDLLHEVGRLAAGFRRLGVVPGDRIAILALNSDDYIKAIYAALWAGSVPVPLNTRWAEAEIADALADCAPRLLLCEARFLPLVGCGRPPECQLVAMEALAELSTQEAPCDDRAGSGDDLAMIFYTGGTTGRSKGVMLSHNNLASNFLGQQAILRYPPGTVYLHVAPMFHLADACCLVGMTMLGATHVVVPAFDPVAVIDLIGKEGVTATLIVPTMLTLLVEVSRRLGRPIPELRNIVYGASPVGEAVLAQALEVFPNARLAQAYGQTEASPIITMLEHEDHLAGHLRAAGRPGPFTDLRIVDGDMREVAAGQVGEVVARGPCVMLGYWRRPELTGQTIVDGWLRTGDAGYRDEAGYLYLVDRLKDMIISGGENVYSSEVENALMKHPAILQCAVIGVPSPAWGEAVHAYVQLRPGMETDADALGAHLRALIAGYKCPKSYALQQEPLPLSGAGKILKNVLKTRWLTDNAGADAAPE